MSESPQTSATSSPASQAVAAYFMRLTDAIGLPRSVGQIFSTLFLSDEPLTFADVVERSGVSKGSASTGLRLLHQFRAIETTVRPDDRRTYYSAQLSLRRVFAGLLDGPVRDHLDEGERLLDQAEARLNGDESVTEARIGSLRKWQRGFRRLLPLLTRFGAG